MIVLEWNDGPAAVWVGKQWSGRWVETDPQVMISIHSFSRKKESFGFFKFSHRKLWVPKEGPLGSWGWEWVESMCMRKKRACRVNSTICHGLTRCGHDWIMKQASWALPFHLTFFFFKHFPNQAPISIIYFK